VSVKNELKSLRRKVEKRASRPTHEAMETYRVAFLNRLARSLAGEDVSGYEMPSCPLPAPMVAGARDRLCERMLAIVDRRERAKIRGAGVEQEQERGQVSTFVSERMRELDESTRGESVPSLRLADEPGNPLLERLRRRPGQFTEDEE
jgi:hypothetical protein